MWGAHVTMRQHQDGIPPKTSKLTLLLLHRGRSKQGTCAVFWASQFCNDDLPYTLVYVYLPASWKHGVGQPQLGRCLRPPRSFLVPETVLDPHDWVVLHPRSFKMRSLR